MGVKHLASAEVDCSSATAARTVRVTDRLGCVRLISTRVAFQRKSRMGYFSVPIRVGNSSVPSGDMLPVEALVDTGASDSMLPASLLEGLRVEPEGSYPCRYANGETETRNYGVAANSPRRTNQHLPHCLRAGRYIPAGCDDAGDLQAGSRPSRAGTDTSAGLAIRLGRARSSTLARCWTPANQRPSATVCEGDFMVKGYHQLSIEERSAVARLRSEGRSIRAVAASLHRSPSTIARELKRNTSQSQGYLAMYAEEQARARRSGGAKPECDEGLRGSGGSSSRPRVGSTASRQAVEQRYR